MKPRFIAGGKWKLRGSPEFQKRLHELNESIRARHEAEWARSGSLRRLILRWRIAKEFRAERRRIEPSTGALYFG